MDTSHESLDISAEIEVETTVSRRCPDEACSYSTSNKSNLNKHVRRMHAGPTTSTPLKSSVPTACPVLICETCGKTYKSRFGLDLHIKNKHTKCFKYRQVCDKGFNQRIQFRFHVSSHSAAGLEVCKFCKTEFTASGSLERHLESCQLEDKPYVCDICQATFARKYKRDEHKRGKHGEMRYGCEVCGKYFGWRSSLKAHRARCEQPPK